MTTIYGLREKGSSEFRYVGLTNFPMAKRLREHRYSANGKWHYQPARWMREVGEVEIVALCFCTKASSRAAERRWVLRLLSEGHRLTNSKLVPRSYAVTMERAA